MAILNARTGLGGAIHLYRGDEVLATFVSESVFKVVMNTASVVDFNQQHRAFLSPTRYPAPERPLVAPVDLAVSQ